MDRDHWTRLIDLAATAFLSDFARIFGGLVSVYVGYKLFVRGASKEPLSGLSVFTSGVVPGLIFIAFGVIVIPGKLEHVFNEYVLVILAGIVSIVLGYLLFKTGIVEAGNTQFKVENSAYKLILSGKAPGLFFMFFGVATLIFYLWTVRPQKEIVTAQLQEQTDMIKQAVSAIERVVGSPDSSTQDHPSRPIEPAAQQGAPGDHATPLPSPPAQR
jgi:hypothetical protein